MRLRRGGVSHPRRSRHAQILISNMKEEFKPTLTPKGMLNCGVFGGSYFGVEDLQGDYDYQSIFEELLKEVTPDKYLGGKYKAKDNLFKIKSGMPYDYWKDKGWMHKDDPYGWFEWYIKYHSGRRHSDDGRQIQRWKEFCGVNGRWRNRIYRRIEETGDWKVSPRIQQSLLHWGYMVNEVDFEIYKEMNYGI